MNAGGTVLRRLARAVYTHSLQKWVWVATDRLHALVSRFSASGARAAVPGRAYYAERDPLIRHLISRVVTGETAAVALSGFDARRFDERVLEYTIVSEWLLQQEAGQDLLDVGCVMNNALVTSLLEERCRNTWLANPALEPVLIRNPVFYHVRDLERAFPLGPQFTLITCLSTIEHIGFDNRHYGMRTPARHSTPTDEPFVQALSKLADLMRVEGQLLVTVPFGVREVVIHPKTGRTAHQVFDVASLAAGLEVMSRKGVATSAEVWEATERGWQRTRPETCKRRYADGCPAAAAVAVLRGVRRASP